MHAYHLSAQSHTLTLIHTQDTTGWRIPIGRGIAGECASTGETFNIRECYEDARFNQKIDRDTGVRACFDYRLLDGCE